MKILSLTNISIRSLTKSIIGMMIIATIVFGITGVYSMRLVGNTQNSWQGYKQSNAPRATALTSVVGSLGYGGMIHQFKNYVIRHDAQRIKRIEAAVSTARGSLESYKSFDLNADEQAAISNIETVMENYESGLRIAHDMIAQGATIAALDSRIKVDDGPAIIGMNQLVKAIAKETAQASLIMSADLIWVKKGKHPDQHRYRQCGYRGFGSYAFCFDTGYCFARRKNFRRARAAFDWQHRRRF